jgi:hypothetical protein
VSAKGRCEIADLSITVANVAKGANAQIANGTAGGTITAGQALWLDATTGTLKATDPTFAGGTKAACVGISLHGALSGQPLAYQTQGQITIGATVTVGEIYLVSKTATGLIMPVGDVVSTNYVTILGVAISATVINLAIQVTGIQHA